jgi:hypothetical protein
MTTVKTLFADDASGGQTGAATDLVTSRASGQLLIATTATPGYGLHAYLEQAPTNSGPWVDVPTDPPIGTNNPILPDETIKGVALISYTRSQRWLQLTLFVSGVTQTPCTGHTFEPPPPLTLR